MEPTSTSAINILLAQAAATPTPTPAAPPIINPTSIQTIFPAARFTDLSTLMGIVTPLLTILATLLVGVMLARAAFLVLSAGDDPDKVAQAKQTATYALIGILIIVSAYFFVRLIGFIFQVNIPL